MTARIGITAVVLAGGRGSRMAEHSPLPKWLIPASDGVAVLGHVLRQVARAGIMRCVIATRHRADEVETWLAGNTPTGLDVTTLRDPEEDYGQLRALARAVRHAGCSYAVTLNGDTVLGFPLADALSLMKTRAFAGADIVTLHDADRFYTGVSLVRASALGYAPHRVQLFGPFTTCDCGTPDGLIASAATLARADDEEWMRGERIVAEVEDLSSLVPGDLIV